jgi:transcriptional regulator with XRE-family HTH domain
MPRRPSPDTTIGERIQARRLLRGWSVRYAASRSGISHATWSRIERGLQAADNRFILTDIATALECSPAELTGTPVPAADREAVAAQVSVRAICNALVDIDLSDDVTRPVRPVAELGQEGLLVRERWQACDYAGAGRLLPTLLRDVHAAVSGPDREQALRLLSDVTFAASSTMRQLGYSAEAWLGAERCRDAAEALEDPVLLAFAAAARAYAAGSCGSFTRALALAERAADALRPHLADAGALEMFGMLHLICANACRALKRADDSAAWTAGAMDLAQRTGETTTLWQYFGPTNVNFWRIATEADGGEPGRVIAIARETTPTVVDAPIRRVYFHCDVARAFSRLRGSEAEAVRHLITAERIAPQHVHSSAFVQETARTLLERAQRSAGGTALRGLCERLSVAV